MTAYQMDFNCRLPATETQNMKYLTVPQTPAPDWRHTHPIVRSSTALCALLAIVGLTACGGGGDLDDTTAATSSETPVAEEVPGDNGASMLATGGLDTSDRSVHIAATSCTTVPAIPTPPSSAKLVTAYGAKPDDTIDDTAAIQSAFDNLVEGEWLVFPKGKYLHNKIIRNRRANVKIYGAGATLHATNPESMAFIMSGTGSALYSFKLTAVTTTRKSAGEHARIWVFNDDYGTGERLVASGITIQGNSVVNATTSGQPESNSASSIGILVSKGDNFLIAQNTVARSLADGIHINGGSTNGRVLNNTVRETGDDMIAVVSYLDNGTQALQHAEDSLDRIAKETDLNKNILVYGNKVSGNYWGRGITVVGGKGVTIRGNTVTGVPGGAGIMAARDRVFGTWGVNNVLIENNIVENIQNTTPIYNPGNKFNGTRSGQAAIEMNAFMYADEAANEVTKDAVSVKYVLARNNILRNSGAGGVRGGPPGSGTISAVDPATGNTVTRAYEAGIVKHVVINTNTMTSMAYGLNIYDEGTWLTTVSCSGNLLDNKGVTVSGTCAAAAPTVTGASLSSCTM